MEAGGEKGLPATGKTLISFILAQRMIAIKKKWVVDLAVEAFVFLAQRSFLRRTGKRRNGCVGLRKDRGTLSE